MQQNDFENEFNREYAPLATIKQVWPINLHLKIQIISTWILQTSICMFSPRLAERTKQTSTRTLRL